MGIVVHFRLSIGNNGWLPYHLAYVSSFLAICNSLATSSLSKIWTTPSAHNSNISLILHTCQTEHHIPPYYLKRSQLEKYQSSHLHFHDQKAHSSNQSQSLLYQLHGRKANNTIYPFPSTSTCILVTHIY